MKKGICIALAVLLFVCAMLTACATLYRPESPPAGWPEELPYLNLAKRNEIDQAWIAAGKTDTGWFTHEPYLSPDRFTEMTGGKRYLGTYQGYDVIYLKGWATVLSGITIGAEHFSANSSFSLVTHKDGSFRDLKEVYEEGLISDTEIAQIARIYQAYAEFEANARENLDEWSKDWE